MLMQRKPDDPTSFHPHPPPPHAAGAYAAGAAIGDAATICNAGGAGGAGGTAGAALVVAVLVLRNYVWLRNQQYQ